jgi:hypothetical protein
MTSVVEVFSPILLQGGMCKGVIYQISPRAQLHCLLAVSVLALCSS